MTPELNPNQGDQSTSLGSSTTGTPMGGQSGSSGQPTEISDDTMVRVPGQTEPVKYGDLSKRLQADYTKKAQEVGALRKAFDGERSTWEATRTQQESYLKNVASQLLAAQNQRASAGKNPLDAIRALPYVDGATAASMMENIQAHGIGPVVKAIEQRDEVIMLLYGQIQQIQQSLKTLNGDRSISSFEGKIGNWMQSRNLGPEMKDFVKELYMAYEGDDLDEEFGKEGGILDRRLTQLSTYHQSQQKQRVEQARPFQLPGKGGNATPGRKAPGLSGRERPAEVADMLWDSIRSRPDST
jgi:hypothetical protein